MPLNAEAAQQYVRQLRRLNGATRALSDPSRLAQRINERLVKEGWVEALLEKRFETEGSSAGTPWPALATETTKQRQRQGFGAAHPILQRSGVLKQAATQGKTIATADRITKKFRDVAAPRYIGGGGHRKRRLNRKNVEATEFFGIRIGATNRIGDYAEALNRKRPFFQPPTREELAPIFARRRELVDLVVWNLTNGNSITGIV